MPLLRPWKRMAKKRKHSQRSEEEPEEIKTPVEDKLDDDPADEHQHPNDVVSEDEALSSEEEDGVDAPEHTTPRPAIHPSITSDGRYNNKQRLLLLSSRWVVSLKYLLVRFVLFGMM